MAKMTRRQVLRSGAAAAVAAGAGLGVPAIIRAQAKDVVILGITSYTGGFAEVGPLMERAWKYAIDEWGGKVLGRPIKFVTRDDETRPASGVRRVEEAVDSEKAQFVIGPWSSGVALPISEVVKRRKVLYFFSGGTEELSGKRCNRYAFQWAASPYTAMHLVMNKYMEVNSRAKRWYLFVLDYTFGWSLEKYLKIAGQKHGVEFVGVDRMPLGSREFSGVIAKAAAAKPDVLGLLTAAQDFILQVREAHNFGLAPKVPIVQGWGLGSEELAQLDGKTRENLWSGCNGYYTHDTPVAKKFADGYEKKFGLPPGYPAIAAYSMMRLVLRGIEKANSTEPPDVAKALEGWETEDWVGRLRINPATHQVERPYFFLRCKKPNEMKGPHDYAEVLATSATPLLPQEFNECKDIGSF